MPRKRKLPEGIRERGGVYYSDFYAAGERVRTRLSTDLEAAKQILNDLRARADKADFGLLDNDYSLKDLKTEYLRHCKQVLKPRTLRRYTTCLNNIVPRLAAVRVRQLSHESVRRYREERLAQDATPRTVNMEVTVLGTMLRWAVEEKKTGNNPLGRLDALPNDHAKEGRALSVEEVKRLLAASPQPWQDVWRAFLLTGMRKGELAALTFRDIDWENCDLIVRGSVAKNHKERRIPIDKDLWDILKKQEAGRKDRQPGKGQTAAIDARVRERFSRDHVFVNRANTPLDHPSALWRAFLRYCGKAGIPVQTLDAEGRVAEHVDIHSLRRTFATELIVGGADPESVRQLLGHSTLEMTMRIYTKIRNQTKRQALGKLSYGGGAVAPEHIIEYPGAGGKPVQNGHKIVTNTEERKAK